MQIFAKDSKYAQHCGAGDNARLAVTKKVYRFFSYVVNS